MTAPPSPKLPELEAVVYALCTGRTEWRVSKKDGAYCMSFGHDDCVNPELEAHEWLSRHQQAYPERFAEYEVQRVVVHSRLQEHALLLLAEAAASRAENERLRDRLEISQRAHVIAGAERDQSNDDAKRYRLLRRGQHWSVIDGIGNTLRADELDAAIDAARAQKGEAK